MISVVYAPKFVRQFKKLHSTLQEEVEEKIALFKKDPADHRLRTHKLHGVLADYWAFSINYRYRIIFGYATKNRVNFLGIDDHDIYKR